MANRYHTEPIEVEEVAYHRNGVTGQPFFVVTFKWVDGAGEKRNMVATVFAKYVEDSEPERYAYGKGDGWHSAQVAVFDRDLLAEGTIAFGVNSWRGDDFQWSLLDAINAHVQA